MVKRKEESAVNPAVAYKENIFKFPGQASEFQFRRVFEKEKEAKALEIESIRAQMKDRQYIELTSIADIKAIYGDSLDNELKGFYNKSSLFFMWEYSQLLKATDDKEYYELLLDSITREQEIDMIDYISASGILDRACVIGRNGKHEVTTKKQLKVLKKFKADGKTPDGVNYEYIKNENGVGYHPKRRPFDLFDLSLATIKKVMEELGMKVPTLKDLQKSNKK